MIDWSDDDRERQAGEPIEDGYTGEPCPYCGRIRVFRRRDGQLECEKCEMVFAPTTNPEEGPA